MYLEEARKKLREQEVGLEVGNKLSFCPQCDRVTVEDGKHGFSRCPLHGWVEGSKTGLEVRERGQA